MSIQTELERIISAKSNIRTAIITKGVDVPENVKIEQLANYILDIGAIKENIGGKLYKVVEINGKTWMAENLDYDYTGAKSHQDYPKFGKYYSKTMATEIDNLITGWHLPTKAEIKSLYTFIGLVIYDNGSELSWDYDKQTNTEGNNALNTILAKGYDEWPFATNTNQLSIVPGAYWYDGWQSFPRQARYWTADTNYSMRIDGNTTESDWPEASYGWDGTASDGYYCPIRLVKD